MKLLIARKQFARLTDLLEEFLEHPSAETDKALFLYEEEIHWPFRATQEQIEAWNKYWTR